MRLVLIGLTVIATVLAGVMIAIAGPEHDTNQDGYVDLRDALDVLAHFGEEVPLPTETPTPTPTAVPTETPTSTPTWISGAPDLEVATVRVVTPAETSRSVVFLVTVRNVGDVIGGAWVHFQLPPNFRRLGLQVGNYVESGAGSGVGSQCISEANGVACWSGGLYPYGANPGWFWMTIPGYFQSATSQASAGVLLDGFDNGDGNPSNNTGSVTVGVSDS